MQGRFMALLVVLFVLTFVQIGNGQGSDGAGPQGTQAPMFDSSKVKVSFEDRVAIQDLFTRYSQALDMGNACRARQQRLRSEWHVSRSQPVPGR